MPQTDRDVLFANEAFLIGVLQAVSGGSVVAALSQSDPLVKFVGKLPFLAFLSAMVLALLAAVLAAHFKHEYKMWDLKTGASVAKGESDEATRRSGLTSTNVQQMRWAMRVALFAIIVGFGVLVTAIWFTAL
jgi:hypothetical protein